jgi:hypothetical protein
MLSSPTAIPVGSRNQRVNSARSVPQGGRHDLPPQGGIAVLERSPDGAAGRSPGLRRRGRACQPLLKGLSHYHPADQFRPRTTGRLPLQPRQRAQWRLVHQRCRQGRHRFLRAVGHAEQVSGLWPGVSGEQDPHVAGQWPRTPWPGPGPGPWFLAGWWPRRLDVKCAVKILTGCAENFRFGRCLMLRRLRHNLGLIPGSESSQDSCTAGCTGSCCG